MVLRRARALLRSDAESKDVLQEVFLSLIERSELQPGAGMVSLLYVATTRRCLNRMRNAQRRSEKHERHLFLVNEAVEEVASGVVMTREILSELDEEEAMALLLSAVNGMTSREIGETLGCSHTHAASLLKRALEAARKDRAHDRR